MENAEVFYHDIADYPDSDIWQDGDGDPMPSGWYYWYCFPGCLPDSDPFGPFDTMEAAEAAVREEQEEFDAQ